MAGWVDTCAAAITATAIITGAKNKPFVFMIIYSGMPSCMTPGNYDAPG